MRNIEELLQVMFNNHDLFCDGLCGWAGNLLRHYKISEDEYWMLRHYIQDNRPSQFSSITAFTRRKDPYFWTRGDIKPRLKWLQNHIIYNIHK